MHLRGCESESDTYILDPSEQGLGEKFYQGVRRPIPGPLASGTLVEIV